MHLLDHTKEFHATKNRYRCRECGRCYPYGLKFLMHIQNHKNSNQTHLCPGIYNCINYIKVNFSNSYYFRMWSKLPNSLLVK